MTLQEVLQLAKQLTPIDKVRLIQQLTPDLERELSKTKSKPKKSLLGLCADSGKAPSATEMDDTRNELWTNFPREDVQTIEAVADTHTIIWYLFNDPRLSDTARQTIETAAANGNQIAIASITLAEIVYLGEKKRIPEQTLERLLNAIAFT